MKYRDLFHVAVTAYLFMAMSMILPGSVKADAGDVWWNEGWPYRILVSTSGTGVIQVSIDFTAALNTIGLNGALIDIRSVRVIPYHGSTPGGSLVYDETYTTLLEDADNPKIGWSGSGVCWTVNDGSAIADKTRFSAGYPLIFIIKERLSHHGSNLRPAWLPSCCCSFPGIEGHWSENDLWQCTPCDI